MDSDCSSSFLAEVVELVAVAVVAFVSVVAEQDSLDIHQMEVFLSQEELIDPKRLKQETGFWHSFSVSASLVW